MSVHLSTEADLRPTGGLTALMAECNRPRWHANWQWCFAVGVRVDRFPDALWRPGWTVAVGLGVGTLTVGRW